MVAKFTLVLCTAVVAVLGVRYFTVEQTRENAEHEDIPMSIRILDPTREVGELAVGEHTISLKLINDSARSSRVIGMDEACMGTVCFGPVFSMQMPIPAHAEINYDCLLKIRQPGPFEIPLGIFIEDHGIRKLTVTLRGVGK